MRKWDYRAAQRPDFIIANSNFTKAQIKKYYGRDSEVIHPPVDIERFKILNKSSISRSRYLVAGRQTPYKRIDLAVAACTQLKLPLTVIGHGPEHKKLIKIAGRNVTFLEGLSDAEVVEYFRTAKAFIFPGVDDFGIVAVEALAAGTPVIAYKGGGALDYIQDGENGLFFKEQSTKSLVEVLINFDKKKFNQKTIQTSAQQFSAPFFSKNFSAYLKKLLQNQ
jgi:glycosyltransferase involved in cell wall biosynthesis